MQSTIFNLFQRLIFSLALFSNQKVQLGRDLFWSFRGGIILDFLCFGSVLVRCGWFGDGLYLQLILLKGHFLVKMIYPSFRYTKIHPSRTASCPPLVVVAVVSTGFPVLQGLLPARRLIFFSPAPLNPWSLQKKKAAKDVAKSKFGTSSQQKLPPLVWKTHLSRGPSILERVSKNTTQRLDNQNSQDWERFTCFYHHVFPFVSFKRKRFTNYIVYFSYFSYHLTTLIALIIKISLSNFEAQQKNQENVQQLA